MHDEAARARIQTICLMILATTAIMYAIYWLRPVLVPFVIAVFVVSGIAPVLDMLQRRLRVNRLVAAGIAFVAGLLVLLLLGGTLSRLNCGNRLPRIASGSRNCSGPWKICSPPR